MVRRLCGLYPGEGRKALQLGLLTFLLSLCTFGAFTLADGLFLEHVGAEHLPLTYFFTAVGLLGAGGVTLWALNRFPVRMIFFFGTLVQCAIYGAFGLLLSGGAELPGAFWIVMKIVNDALWIVMFTGLWGFLEECYDLQDAKRLFGMLNGTIILGSAAGAGLVAVALGFTTPAWIFGTIALLVLAAIWVLSWASRHAQHPNVETPLPGTGSLLRGILNSRFTLCLLGFTVLVIVLELLAEFNYLSAMQAILGGSENRIASFLSSARAWTYLGNVIFSVFIYSRCVRRAGVNNLLLTTPIAFLFLFSFWSMGGGLAMAVGGMALVEGFDVSVTDSNFNLAINGVPARLRAKVRALAEYLVQPLGMIFASGLLYAFHAHSYLVGIAVAAVMLGVTLYLRRAYAKAIFRDLTESTICFGRPALTWLRTITRGDAQLLRSQAQEGNELAIEALALLSSEPKGSDLCAEELLERLQSARNARERRTLEDLIVASGPALLPDLLALAKDPQADLRLRTVAGRALGRIDRALLRRHLHAILAPELDYAFTYFYHGETIQQRYPHHNLRLLRDGLASGYARLIHFAVHLLGIAGDVQECDLLLRSLRSANHKIHSHAVETLEKCAEKRLFHKLYPLIDDRPTLDKLRLFIKRGHTPCALPELLTLLEDSPSKLDSLVATAVKSDLAQPSWQAVIA